MYSSVREYLFSVEGLKVKRYRTKQEGSKGMWAHALGGFGNGMRQRRG